MSKTLFNENFLVMLESLVELHHSIYPRIPPQGIFFESLVEQAFKRSGWPTEQVKLSTANTPKYDLMVGTSRISLKTETGSGTREGHISITKLCTTETGMWNSASLVQHTMRHLSRYDHMLMLRAIWRQKAIHYQLLEIPLDLLKRIGAITISPVGHRAGRQSMASDVYDKDEKIFRVHFDGADGKCQIHHLPVARCKMFLEWDQPIVV